MKYGSIYCIYMATEKSVSDLTHWLLSFGEDEKDLCINNNNNNKN